MKPGNNIASFISSFEQLLLRVDPADPVGSSLLPQVFYSSPGQQSVLSFYLCISIG
ncbi:MAG: hypothetical protein V9E88_02785 [Ferruginibacter sp.]